MDKQNESDRLLAMWDQLVESALKAGSMREQPTAELKLKSKPAIHWLHRKKRDLAQIEDNLRGVLRSLVLGQSPWPLFLHGLPGTGKTCAALVLLDYAGGMYFTAQGIADDLARAWKGELLTPSGKPMSALAMWKELERSALLVIDELGTRTNISDHHYDTVKRLLDLREGQPLVMISNWNLEAIADIYDDRVASRISAGTVVAVEGRDRRLER